MGGFTILWWVLPYIDLNQPQVHMCPPILNPSHLLPDPLPLDCPRALALGALLHDQICTGHLFYT